MDPFVNESDFALLQGDRFSFSVLDRILRGPCAFIWSDHSRLILCHSTPPYPVWIWSADGLTEAEKERAWKQAEECCPLAEGYRLNLKYELADYFLKRARSAGLNAGISKELFAYDCPAPVAPEQGADGGLYLCQPEDAEKAAALLAAFCVEIGEHPPSPQRAMEKAREKIENKALFFWKDAAGGVVACCGWRHNEGLATICDVYTLPEARRKHYAQNLVYALTKEARDAGCLPALYTNANYAASNACYQKIGYRLRGALCMISLQ